MKGDYVLATSRYHAGDLINEAGLLPIGITVGAAKWLSYELAANVGMLAPFGLRKIEPFSAFEKAYRSRLESFGPPAIRRVLEAIIEAHGARGAVLLCFENVLEGEDCHRRTFAAWWEKRTGQVVPELVPGYSDEDYGWLIDRPATRGDVSNLR